MATAIKRFFAWISGEAPDGQRKLVFCTRLELMLFGLLLLKPAGDIALELVNAMVIIGITGVGGNGVEWITKAFTSKKVPDGDA